MPHSYAQKPRMLFHEPKSPECYSTSPSCRHGRHRKPHKNRNRPTPILVQKQPQPSGHTHGHVIGEVASLGTSGLSPTHFAANWAKVTSDPWVLETLMGYKVEFFALPSQKCPPGLIDLESPKAQTLTQEIRELAFKKAITTSDGYISQIFLVPKSDGSWHPVVNLKSLNTWVVPHHFKMESISTVKGLLIRGDWMVKLDLKDAYLFIPIHRSHQKFLRFQRFQWDSREWQFQALPFGLSSAPSAPSR